jgi:hypothetical protein
MEVPQRRGAPQRQRRPLPTRQNGRQPDAFDLQLRMTDRVDAAVQPQQPPGRETQFDRAAPDAESAQLS